MDIKPTRVVYLGFMVVAGAKSLKSSFTLAVVASAMWDLYKEPDPVFITLIVIAIVAGVLIMLKETFIYFGDAHENILEFTRRLWGEIGAEFVLIIRGVRHFISAKIRSWKFNNEQPEKPKET